jgi:hypothetical protein
MYRTHIGQFIPANAKTRRIQWVLSARPVCMLIDCFIRHLVISVATKYSPIFNAQNDKNVKI